MATVNSIIFQVDKDFYGLETRLVKEVIWVPELFQSPALPTGIAGMFSYRGTVIPVLDLHQKMGGKGRKMQIHDQVVVVEWQERVLGLLVDRVEEVTALGIERMDTSSPPATDQGIAGLGVVGVAKFGNHTAKMLDPSSILRDLHASETGKLLDSLASVFLNEKGAGRTGQWFLASSEGFEELTQEECQLLQERADALAQGEPFLGGKKWIPLAVVRLNEEYVGLDPIVVREFADLGHLVPLPSCPNFVLGHMNLRGEVLTVLDLRHVLNMPVVEQRSLSKVVVLQFETYVFGIAVQEVMDCVTCEQKGSGLTGSREKEGSFLSMISEYRGKSLKYLDVSHLIASKVLEVYEEV